MNELISIIIPVYNRENTIKKCINSILSQTYNNIEIIIVDDASTDKTKEEVLSINNKKIRYLTYTENKGACYARNYGVKNSYGNIIAFQDSDDVWHKDKLEKQYNFLREGNYDFVFCCMSRKNSKGKNIIYPINKKSAKSHTFKDVLIENCASTQTMMMKKEVAEDVRFDEKVKKYQDWDFMLRLVKKYKVGFLNEVLLDSEVSNNSISKTVNPLTAIQYIYDKYKSDITLDDEIYSTFLSKFGDAIRSNNIEGAKMYYRNSLEKYFHMKVFLKYLYCLLKLQRRKK